MGTDVINAPELAALVKPVRALLKKNKKMDAIKLVRERTDFGLKDSKEFVEHVQALPGTKTRKVAELWTSTTSPN
jgi:ribosomal protein L7/L12